jgi:hypothetical protein
LSLKRTTPLKRSGGLKRTGSLRRDSQLKRTDSLRRTQMVRKPSPRKDDSFPPDSDPELRCRSCQKRGAHQHHVVRAQDVEKWHGDTKDRRNALRVCWDCHEKHHLSGRPVKLKTSILRDENIEFAFELMGAAAADYLRGKYDDSAGDPRIEREFIARMPA